MFPVRAEHAEGAAIDARGEIRTVGRTEKLIHRHALAAVQITRMQTILAAAHDGTPPILS